MFFVYIVYNAEPMKKSAQHAYKSDVLVSNIYEE